MRKKAPAQKNGSAPKDPTGITQITVGGYKSISREQSIEIRPLTILAGANSSGKSSIMQPLLLMKQTLESSFDPGALLLNGPNVLFTSAEQMFSRSSRRDHPVVMKVGLRVNNHAFTVRFGKHRNNGLEILTNTYVSAEEELTLSPGMTQREILSIFPFRFRALSLSEISVEKDRCFLLLKVSGKRFAPLSDGSLVERVTFSPLQSGEVSEAVVKVLSELIHLPGLRGNPARTYPVTAVGAVFPGTFENYTASIIANWQVEKKEDEIAQLSTNLEKLGLTWKVAAKRVNDIQVELQVGRLTRAGRKGERDLVNIADVGLGVSQILPVLVALLAAKPGQLVYLEQPEIHLHPRAQTALAQVLADAANRGVRVVVETHSSLLLLGIQTLVAEEKLSPDKVKLHWFTQGNDGVTTVRSTDLDETGAFGDWPEDFAEVSLTAQSRYLDAAEAKLMESGNGLR